MKNLLFAVLALICISCTLEVSLKINLESEIFTPEQCVIAKTESPLLIDGKADEQAWEQTPFSNPFVDIEGNKTPKYETRIKMLWDNQYLYVLANLEEPHIWANLRQHDTVIFYNNDFEVFIDPSGSTYNYGEIELNALNTVWDLKLDKPYRVSGNADNSWNLDQLKTAVSIAGTINDPSDVDSSWTVEMAIPLEPIMQLKGSGRKYPQQGEQWRINFSRVNWNFDLVDGVYDRKKENGKYLPEYNWVWSKQGVINMHEPEKWGFIQFSDSTVVEKSEFVPDDDLYVKLAAYALFRHVSFGDLKYLQSEDEGYSRKIEATLPGNEIIEATFTKTGNGFAITVRHPEESKDYTINQDGWLEIN